MKHISVATLISAILLFQISSSAQQQSTSAAKPGSPERYEAWLKRTGGHCKGTSKGGEYLFLDCTSNGLKGLGDIVKRMSALFDLVMTCEQGTLQPKEYPVDAARRILKERNNVSAITIIYEGGIDNPIEIYSPMEKMSILNITPLSSSDQKVLSDRLLAMSNRAVIFTAGGVMQFGFDGVMKNLQSISDIDSLSTKTAHPISVQQIKLNAPEIGIAQHLHSTYRVACRQGWAPAPTNDIQKAIWDEIHSEIEKGPPKALQILPPMPK